MSTTPQEIVLLNLIYCTRESHQAERKYYDKALNNIFKIAEANGLSKGLKKRLKEKILEADSFDEEAFMMLEEVNFYISLDEFLACLEVFPSFTIH